MQQTFGDLKIGAVFYYLGLSFRKISDYQAEEIDTESVYPFGYNAKVFCVME